MNPFSRARAAAARLRPSGDPTGAADLAWRVALAGALALLTLFLFPPRGVPGVAGVRAGTIATDDVIAPFDFDVRRSDDDLARRREQAALTVPPAFSVRPGAADTALARIEVWLERVGPAAGNPAAPLAGADGRALDLRPAEARALRSAEVRDALAAFARAAVPAIYDEHDLLSTEELAAISSAQVAVARDAEGEEDLVARRDLVALEAGAEVPALTRLARGLDPDVQRLALQLLPALLLPDLVPRPGLTAARRTAARSAVDPVESEILAGELVVAAHTRVTPDQEAKVRALQGELSARRGGFTADDLRVAFGRYFVNVAVLLLLGFYLWFYRRDVFGDLRALGVLAAIWGLVTVAAAVADGVEAIPSHATPIALASVLVAVLWDTRLAAVVTMFLVVSLVPQGDLGYPVLWTGLLSGLAGAWSVRRVRRRTQFYESLVFILVGQGLAIAAIALMRLWGWGEFGSALAWGGLSAAVSVFLAMGLLPVLEWASGRTTDLTLLELADLNRPLLKRLLLEAPGSYHHSIIVGNLAEAAAEGIGANSLLARVGAYYHDIGKVERPEYFAENQRQDGNPHDALPPRESARIIGRHVPDGVELARGAGLPEVVIDFIREHHGTCRMAYFWHKAIEDEPTEPRLREDFHYAGPRPRSKETAVVMLADSVEAACRVVREPSADAFRDVVRRIVEARLDERQLEQTNLTFHDLAVVEDHFVAVLTGIHHHRIEYPGAPARAAAERTEDEPHGPLPRVGRTST